MSPKLIDLSMTIGPHFRWKPERRVIGDLGKGDTFQSTWLGCIVHGFTHIDAPRHIDPAGATTSEALTLERVTGEAALVDLSHVPPRMAIGAKTLGQAAGHVRPGDIVLLKTGWERRADPHTPAFWNDSPWMTREACEWLLARAPKMVGYDFPQDYPIRELLSGRQAPIEEFVTHDVLLRAGIPMIEYLCNLGALPAERAMLFALPLKLAGADGAPARVVAWIE